MFNSHIPYTHTPYTHALPIHTCPYTHALYTCPCPIYVTGSAKSRNYKIENPDTY